MQQVQHASNDIIHAIVVLVIVIAATVFSAITNDHSGNVWIVYGSGVAYAAGRSGAIAYRTTQGRSTDVTVGTGNNA